MKKIKDELLFNFKKWKAAQQMLVWKKTLYLLILVIIITVLVITDQITKEIDWKKFGEINIYGFKFIKFGYHINYGAAFGALDGKINFIITFIIISTIVYIICLLFCKTKINILAFTLLISGAIGNLIDRFKNNGGVIDFISFPFLPGIMGQVLLNMADAIINLGILFLIIGLFKNIVTNYLEEKRAEKIEAAELTKKNLNNRKISKHGK